MENNLHKHIVGIGSVCADSGNAELTAYALGSCIALCLYEPVARVGSMAHILLPSESYTGHRAAGSGVNTKYADHALASALEQMVLLGADKRNIRAAIIGGAEMFPLSSGSTKTLNIGEMNVASVKEELTNSGIPLDYSAVGGTKSRTVVFRIPGDCFDRQLTVRSPLGIH